MHPLTHNDIESELSYAYLHAVAAHAKVGCNLSSRTLDGNGIDATLTGWGPFPAGGYLQEISISIQLKATISAPTINNGYISYNLQGISRYNDLRSPAIAVPRILIVMFLPELHADWLAISEEQLLLKKCAYWVSLRNAPATSNTTSQTIYIPQAQIFNVQNLTEIFSRLSRREEINYQSPA
jgi:hypothetical protein